MSEIQELLHQQEVQQNHYHMTINQIMSQKPGELKLLVDGSCSTGSMGIQLYPGLQAIIYLKKMTKKNQMNKQLLVSIIVYFLFLLFSFLFYLYTFFVYIPIILSIFFCGIFFLYVITIKVSFFKNGNILLFQKKCIR